MEQHKESVFCLFNLQSMQIFLLTDLYSSALERFIKYQFSCFIKNGVKSAGVRLILIITKWGFCKKGLSSVWVTNLSAQWHKQRPNQKMDKQNIHISSRLMSKHCPDAKIKRITSQICIEWTTWTTAKLFACLAHCQWICLCWLYRRRLRQQTISRWMAHQDDWQVL